MSWAAVAGAAIGVVGSSMSSGGGSDRNGGAGTQTQDRSPWAPSQPWIMNNLMQGQNLQQAYTAQPFSGQQQAAYGNQNAQSDYMRQAVPGLLGQLSSQPVGFDRGNPNARPAAFNFNSAGGGNLASLRGSPMTNIQQQTPQVAAPAAPAQGTFTQQTSDPANQWMMGRYGAGATGGDLTRQGVGGTPLYGGGYGDFKYGQTAPEPGTKAYRDMQEYFMNGGSDPYNMYGKGSVGSGGGW